MYVGREVWASKTISRRCRKPLHALFEGDAPHFFQSGKVCEAAQFKKGDNESD
jgi:hypothetical protein